jgi:DNA polymerase gamma 1
MAAGPSSEGLQAPTTTISRKGKEKAIEEEIQSGASPNSAYTLADCLGKPGLRRNAVGVQLLSPSLHAQLFPGPPLPKSPASLLKISEDHLEKHGLKPEGAAVLDELSFDMPPLEGSNIRDHFHALGSQTAEPYLSMAHEFANAELPPKPTAWEMERSGWTKYSLDGSMEAVDDLGEESIVSFDVETLYKLSPYPVMATAVTPNGWYSWLSPSLFETAPTETPIAQLPWETVTPPHYPRHLIPLFPPGSELPRLVIGHNVGYDRARVLEEYDLTRTSTRWLDTLSFHVATRGITSVQRPAWLKHRKIKKEKLDQESQAIEYLREQAELQGDIKMLDSLADSAADVEAMQKRWEDVTAMNSLAEVASLHCGYPVDKSIRSRFADESITHASQLRPELHDLLSYCGSDVKITHDVYTKVLPLFVDSCPHPASFAGVLAMGSSFLPVNESWQEYLEAAETKYREMDQGVKTALRILAEKVRKAGKQEGDAWSEQLDWKEKNARWPDNFDPTGESSTPNNEPIAAVEPTTTSTTPSETNTGMPAWLAPFAADHKELLSNRSLRNIVPLLLRMTYKSHPVAYLSEHMWCFYVPHSQISSYVDAHGPPVELSSRDIKLEPLLEDHAFFRLGGPNDAKRSKLVGASMKGLVTKGVLRSEGYQDLLVKLTCQATGLEAELWECAQEMKKRSNGDAWASQLDWTSQSMSA